MRSITFFNTAPAQLLALVLLSSGALSCASGQSGATPASAGQPQPGQLLDSIRSYQSRDVKRSVGTYDYQCFTDADYANFQNRGVARKDAQEFQDSAMFPKLIRAIRNMPEAKREALLSEARNTAHPTFATVGSVPSDGSAQTDAGRNAELDIASEIVAVVERALKSGAR